MNNTAVNIIPELHSTEVIFSGSSEDLMPLFAGYQYCPPAHTRETIRDHYLLCCVLDGYGTFYNASLRDHREIDVYRMKSGDTFLITPDRLVSYAADPEQPWTYAWIGFSGKKAAEYLNCTGFRHSPVMATGTDLYHQIRRLTDHVIREGTSLTRYMKAVSALWNMIADLMNTSCEQYLPRERNPYTERALELIRHGYHQPLTVSGLAAELGITREHFYTVFHHDTGQSPSDYLLHFRIDKACDLLRHSHYPIHLIAQHTGFSDISYFSRRFRKCTGMSPAAYRDSVHAAPSE